MFSKEEIAKRALELEEHLIDYSQRDFIYSQESYKLAYKTLLNTLLKGKQGEIKSPITNFPFGRMLSEREGWLRESLSIDLYLSFKASVGTLTQKEFEAKAKKRLKRYEKWKKLRP